jgi:hypothetical protein
VRTTAVRLLVVGAIASLLVTGCRTERVNNQKVVAHGDATVSTHGDHRSGPGANRESRLRVRMAPTHNLSPGQLRAADVVLEYWRRYGIAVSTNDVKHSGLSKVVNSATSVKGTQRVVDGLKAKGQQYRGTLVINVRSVGLDGESATVDTCIDQTEARLVNSTGATVREPKKENILPIAHTLVKQERGWLVDKLAQGGFTC